MLRTRNKLAEKFKNQDAEKIGANDTLRETPSAEGNFRAQGKKNAEFKRL